MNETKKATIQLTKKPPKNNKSDRTEVMFLCAFSALVATIVIDRVDDGSSNLSFRTQSEPPAPSLCDKSTVPDVNIQRDFPLCADCLP